MSDRGRKRDALTSEERALIEDIVRRRAPGLVTVLNAMSIRRLTEDEQNALRIAVTDELAATGYLDSEESDLRGLKLDALIDALAHV